MVSSTYPPCEECEDVEVGIHSEGEGDEEVDGTCWGHHLGTDLDQLVSAGEGGRR